MADKMSIILWSHIQFFRCRSWFQTDNKGAILRKRISGVKRVDQRRMDDLREELGTVEKIGEESNEIGRREWTKTSYRGWHMSNRRRDGGRLEERV